MISGINIAISIFLLLFGLYSYVFFYLKTKDYFNPFGMTNIIWCAVCSISSLHLSYLQEDWFIETYIIIIVFPLIVFFVGLKNIGKILLYSRISLSEVRFTNTYVVCMRMIFIICFVCSLIEWKNYGFDIMLTDYEGVDAKSLFSGISGIHYGTIFMPYCSVVAIFELCYRKSKTLFTNLFLGICIIWPVFYSIFVLISRGTVLIIALGGAYIICRKFSVKFRYLLIFIALILVGFITLSFYRLWNGSLVFNVIPGHPVLSSLYSYIGLNIENLNKLVEKGASFTIAKRTLWGICQIIGLDKVLTVPVAVETTKFFNATTICYSFYDDIGIVGVCVYTYVYYTIIAKFYLKSFKDIRYMLIIAVLQKAILMSFFGDYYATYRVNIFPYLLIAVIILSMRCTIYTKRRKVKCL